MGAALARVLLDGGVPLTVWNRTAAKAEAFVEAGARFAVSPAEAVTRGEVVIVCVASYPAIDPLLQTPECVAALRGKVLVQLTTGCPREARTSAAWAARHGSSYLDGAILVTPGQVGGEASALLVAGDTDAFAKADPVLRRIGRHTTYLGDDAGAAAALDLAFLAHFFGGLLGFYHGARIMEAEGQDVAVLGEMVAEVAPALGQIFRGDAGTIKRGTFAATESTLRNSATVVELLHRHACEAGLDRTFTSFADASFRRGIAAGFAQEDAAALIKILRVASHSAV